MKIQKVTTIFCIARVGSLENFIDELQEANREYSDCMIKDMVVETSATQFNEKIVRITLIKK